MGRPTKMTGWWKRVLDEKAGSRVDLLANLCGVSVRTIHRWATGDIKIPDFEQRKVIRKVAGKELVGLSTCPACLRVKAKASA